jgi:hypothetical protein
MLRADIMLCSEITLATGHLLGVRLSNSVVEAVIIDSPVHGFGVHVSVEMSFRFPRKSMMESFLILEGEWWTSVPLVGHIFSIFGELKVLRGDEVHGLFCHLGELCCVSVGCL